MIQINEKSWKTILKNEFDKPYFDILLQNIATAYQKNTCYPPENLIFQAFEKCSFNDLKVVIIGQDPYHGPNQANGLAFSVKNNQPLPPSLRNIFKELASDFSIEQPKNGNLEHWAQQGVLLLNATLTVEENKAGSHQKMGWETFTDRVIEIINTEKEHVVFLLWGAFAHKKCKKIDSSRHLVLKAKHPSPLSANFGGWFGENHFSKANTYLELVKKAKINW